MKCNLIHLTLMWVIKLLSTVCLLLALITPSQAANSVESNETLPAVGRMPVLSALNLPVGSIASGATEPVSDKAVVGMPLTLADMGIDWSNHITINFTDVDGDIESGSFYEWLIDGIVVGNSITFTPTTQQGGQLLSVRVTPKTQTGDPDIGNAVTSNTIVVRSAIIDRFSTPDLTRRNWDSANAYCLTTLGNDYRLPTISELQQLYYETTISISTGNNAQICQRYGWPLNSLCGGSNSHYWTSEAYGTGLHFLVSMYDGNSNYGNDNFNGHVTCIHL